MKEILTDKWAYSNDGERYYGESSSKEEAIEEAKSDYGFKNKLEFYVGQCVKHIFTENDCDTYAENILEMMDETLGDECGEWSETWIENITREQEQELDSLLAKTVIDWLNRNDLQPSCFTIQNAEMITIKE